MTSLDTSDYEIETGGLMEYQWLKVSSIKSFYSLYLYFSLWTLLLEHPEINAFSPFVCLPGGRALAIGKLSTIEM